LYRTLKMACKERYQCALPSNLFIFRRSGLFGIFGPTAREHVEQWSLDGFPTWLRITNCMFPRQTCCSLHPFLPKPSQAIVSRGKSQISKGQRRRRKHRILLICSPERRTRTLKLIMLDRSPSQSIPSFATSHL